MHEYESRAALAEALATGVAAVLAGGIATRGMASLALSGGSTPKLFLETLSRIEIDWASVSVTLVDERWVPEESPRSNAGFLRRHFLKGPAAAAAFQPLHAPGPIETAVPELAERVRLLPHPFDALILGMGTDGHTASFFPGGTTLGALLDPAGTAPLGAIEAPGAGEPRVTLTLPAIVDARFLALHIEGEEKRAVLKAALEPGPIDEMPVRAVLRAARPDPIAVFWAP
ncbi:6-phosphogluconolactonase [Aurantimonas sp. Leaf443]|nr:6-phosphogluconolactonase [Aurantimonas sp. Leaf443]